MANETITNHKSRYQSFPAGVLSNWHFMRWLRLAIGLFLSWQMVQNRDVFTGLIAGVFLFQAITNTGCCGASGCATPKSSTPPTSENKEVVYDEIKNK